MNREQEAITAYPELRMVVALREAGWFGLALGLRITGDDPPALVWERTGTVAEVAHALLELPPPEARTAPTLVIGSAPRLWTPR